jgi:hypothetical protein
MKRPWLILIGGLAMALLAYGGAYFCGSASSRGMTRSQTPELAWLQQEFHLSDAEFERISKLHESYTAACAERCKRIDARNAELQDLLAATNTVTPEIEKTLQEAAQMRAECQKEMLQHFYQVSQTMPPEQGRRYLSWMIARTLGPEHAAMTHDPQAAAHEHHHHE